MPGALCELRSTVNVKQGSAVAGLISSKKNLSSPTFVGATALMLIGSGLLSTVSNDTAFEPSQYGYQVIFGFGAGLLFASTSILVTYAQSLDNIGKY